jgi:hypothetical protein
LRLAWRWRVQWAAAARRGTAPHESESVALPWLFMNIITGATKDGMLVP